MALLAPPAATKCMAPPLLAGVHGPWHGTVAAVSHSGFTLAKGRFMKRAVWPLAVVLALALAGPLAAQTDSTGTSNSNTGTMSDSTGTHHHGRARKHKVRKHRRTHKKGAAADSTGANGSLPRTASPLPLVAGSGAVTLALGAWLSSRRRRPS